MSNPDPTVTDADLDAYFADHPDLVKAQQAAEAEVERLRFIEDKTPTTEGVWWTPGQLWHHLLEANAPKRWSRLESLIYACQQAESEHRRADEVESERDALAAKVARVAALHVPWFEIDGVRHDFTVIAFGSDVPADHVCRIGAEHQQCTVYPDAPEDSEHQVLACAECRGACEDYDVVGHPFWPCTTAAVVADLESKE